MRYLLLISFIVLAGCSPEFEGCMDTLACNYHPEATIDDESCIYPENAYDCDGMPSDFRLDYLGLWTFQADWFMASLHIGGASEGTYVYTDSIIATDVINQLKIPYSPEGDNYYLIIDANGDLTIDVNIENTVAFEGYFIAPDSLYIYRQWEYDELDGNAWGYTEYMATKLY